MNMYTHAYTQRFFKKWNTGHFSDDHVLGRMSSVLLCVCPFPVKNLSPSLVSPVPTETFPTSSFCSQLKCHLHPPIPPLILLFEYIHLVNIQPYFGDLHGDCPDWGDLEQNVLIPVDTDSVLLSSTYLSVQAHRLRKEISQY